MISATVVPTWTILTATYNRARELPRLKASLDAQENRDFEWLIVDDGSVDGTDVLAASWAEESAYPTRYLKRENGGKHRALNDGVRAARGRWLLFVDSDDRLAPGAIAALSARVPEADADPSICGILGLKVSSDGAMIGEAFPRGMVRRSALDLAFRDRMRGDKSETVKREVMLQFPFPEFEGERFMTENVVWYRIARAGYDYLLLQAPIQVCEYRSDGLSARSLDLRLANPAGNLLYYAEALESPYPARLLLREAVNFARFAAHAKRGTLPPGIPKLSTRARFLKAIASPFGFVAALRDRIALARRRKSMESGAT